jgi:hypothetical protein
MALPSIRPSTAPVRSSVSRGSNADLPVYRPASRDAFLGAGPALVPRPASAYVRSPSQEALRPASANRRVLPAFFFAESSEPERSDRYPTPMSYHVVDEDGSARTTGRDHTEGSEANIARAEQLEMRHVEGDFRRFRYVDFQTPPMSPELVNRGAGVVPINDIAKWMDASKPRTRLDAYPMLVLLREILRRLLKSEFDASDALIADLRARLKELEELMEADREAHKARMAELAAQRDGLLDDATQLEGQISKVKNETAEMKAHLSVQLSGVKEKLRHVERDTRSLQKQIDKTNAKLAELAERLANAVRHAYEPAALALALHQMLQNTEILDVLKQLSYEERMNLFRTLLSTCRADEKNGALEVVMDDIKTGELQLEVLHDCLSGPQRMQLMQLLLAEVEHSPEKIYAQLGADVLLETSVEMVQETVIKGCDKMVLLSALGLTATDLARAMLEEIGVSAFLSRLDVGREALCDTLGLEEPEEPAPPPPKPETTETEMQTDPEPEPEPEPEPQAVAAKKRSRSKVLNFFGKVPLKGGPSPMAFNPLRKMISTLYEAKIMADEVDDREGHTRSPFPEFIQEHFINHYGLKSLADKQLGKLVTGVRKYSNEGSKNFDLRIKIFGVLSGILAPDEYSSVTLNFVLDVMRMLFVSSMIDESLNHSDCAVSWDQAEIAIECTCELFEKPVPAGLMDTVKSLGEEVRSSISSPTRIDNRLVQSSP